MRILNYQEKETLEMIIDWIEANKNETDYKKYPSQAWLCVKYGLSRQTISLRVRKLIKKGLIETLDITNKEKSVLAQSLRVTDKGLQELERAYQAFFRKVQGQYILDNGLKE